MVSMAKNLLATGGGTADRCLRFFNTITGECLNTVDTHLIKNMFYLMVTN